MLWKYIDFESVAIKMLEQHQEDENRLQRLMEQYREIEQDDGVKAVQYDRSSIKSGLNTDKIVNQIIKKETVKQEIDELEKERKVFNLAWNQLTTEERQVLETLFMQGLKKQDAINLLCEQLACEIATVYRRRGEAVGRFKKLLFGV